jgi:hypothetical protein
MRKRSSIYSACIVYGLHRKGCFGTVYHSINEDFIVYCFKLDHISVQLKLISYLRDSDVLIGEAACRP